MAAPHPLPENVTGFVDLVVWASGPVSNGFYGEVVFWMFFLVFFIAFKKTDTTKAFAGASFLSANIGIFLFIMGILSLQSVVIIITMVAIGVLFLALEKKN